MSEKTEEAGPVEVPALSQMGATFAERAKARAQAEAKQVDVESDVEDKAVARKKTASKKG